METPGLVFTPHEFWSSDTLPTLPSIILTYLLPVKQCGSVLHSLTCSDCPYSQGMLSSPAQFLIEVSVFRFDIKTGIRGWHRGSSLKINIKEYKMVLVRGEKGATGWSHLDAVLGILYSFYLIAWVLTVTEWVRIIPWHVLEGQHLPECPNGERPKPITFALWCHGWLCCSWESLLVLSESFPRAETVMVARVPHGDPCSHLKWP